MGVLMRAGVLDKRLTIQRKQVTQDGFGAEVITWVEVATVWAQIAPLQGRELLIGKAIEAEQTTRITIRHIDGLRSSMRAVWGTHVYDITDVQPVEQAGKMINMFCREVVL